MIEVSETLKIVNIIVNEITETVSINVTQEVIAVNLEVAEMGIQGIPGLSAYYIAIQNGFIGTEIQWLDSLRENSIPDFIQVTPSITWIVNHNSGKKRSLELFTVGGFKMVGDIQIISNNQTIATFLQPIAGFAKVI